MIKKKVPYLFIFKVKLKLIFSHKKLGFYFNKH